MQAIAHRAKDIGAIDENQYVSFRIQMTKRKELTHEPLDDEIPMESPGLLFNAWNKLVQAGRLPELGSDEEAGISLNILHDYIGVLPEGKPSFTGLSVIDN